MSLNTSKIITDSDYVLRRMETNLSPTPGVRLILCPEYSPVPGRRDQVEARLPVMGLLWETWSQVRTEEGPTTSLLPWANDTAEVRQFLARVMYEGGRLAAADCQDLLENCSNLKQRKVFTERGLCLEVSPGNLSTNNHELWNQCFKRMIWTSRLNPPSSRSS